LFPHEKARRKSGSGAKETSVNANILEGCCTGGRYGLTADARGGAISFIRAAELRPRSH